MVSSKEDAKKESLLHFANSVNVNDLVSVSKRLIFVQDASSGIFSAKLTIVNQSPRYVSYKVRPSDQKKFAIRPRYGSIRPLSPHEVIISTTSAVQHFQDISSDSFCVFAVPIYDQRQLERKSLSILWQAHGTDLFPLETTEQHRICSILPRCDTYFRKLSPLERIPHLNVTLPWTTKIKDPSSKPIFDQIGATKVFSEHEFFARWPCFDSSVKPDPQDPSLHAIMEDWHQLAQKIHAHTQQVVDNTRSILMTFVVGVFAVIGVVGLGATGNLSVWRQDTSPGFEAPAPPAPVVEEETGLVSWIPFGWWK